MLNTKIKWNLNINDLKAKTEYNKNVQNAVFCFVHHFSRIKKYFV